MRRGRRGREHGGDRVDDTAHAQRWQTATGRQGDPRRAKLYTLLPSSVSAMTVLDVNRATRSAAFAAEGEARVYHGTASCWHRDGRADPCVEMRFGRFGREENALVTVAANGGRDAHHAAARPVAATLRGKRRRRAAVPLAVEENQAGRGADRARARVRPRHARRVPEACAVCASLPWRRVDRPADMNAARPGGSGGSHVRLTRPCAASAPASRWS